MRVAIIGAGTAGLTAAKNCLHAGFDVVVYELYTIVGGTWIYTDQTGKDEYGLHIHTSMYRGLFTNLPKEIMGYPDFAIPDQEKSYISQADMLSFLDLYADHFDIKKHIKYQHYVIRVCPIEDNKWEVIVRDLPNNKYETLQFDAVMVCNGHFHTPSIPNYPGKILFKGKQIHSHDYRYAEPFKDEKVLVIGAGPSGMDMAFDVSKYANRLTLSHHMDPPPTTLFPENVDMKPDVERITETGVVFKDGTEQSYTLIFYCTGYKFTFPFLSTDCGIHVDENYVQPLYKHCINISNPTMSIIGLPFYVCAAHMCDLQARFVLKYLTGGRQLPSMAEMQADTERQMNERYGKGLKKKHAHMMGPFQAEYYEDLANTAGLQRIPPVMSTIHKNSSDAFNADLLNFRKDRYRVVDDFNFEKY